MRSSEPPNRIEALSSTQNQAKARDPEMSSTKSGRDWSFGMKAHIGVGAERGIVHSLNTTTAKVHDGRVRDDKLHGEKTSSRLGQDPRASVHPSRARQPVPRATKADGMRTRLSVIGIVAAQLAKTARTLLETRHQRPRTTFKSAHPRSRRR